MSSLVSPPCSANVGEALAAQLAISLACSLHFDRFIIEGDSTVVIQALNQSLSNIDWRISPIIKDSLEIFLLLPFGKLERLIEVLTSVYTQWHVGPQPAFILATFPFPTLHLLLSLYLVGLIMCIYFVVWFGCSWFLPMCV